MRILYDSKLLKHKTPFGCIKKHEECEITLYIPKACNTVRAFLMIKADDGLLIQLPLNKLCEKDAYEHYNCVFSLYREGLYFYYFKIETDASSFSLYKFGAHDTNIEEGELWQLSCIKNDAPPIDEFYSGAVYYQIFPDRFFKEALSSPKGKIEPFTIHKNEDDTPDYLPASNGKILNNDFFGGNLMGIEKKLPYLKSLGVNVIYLNPIFFAYSNHRYDTADYMKVDPLLGTEEDFKRLCDSAHEQGMRIILDGVFSHTGADSIYFDKLNRFGNGAYSAENSPYKSWYSIAADKSYPSWWGIETLPCVNELAPSFSDYIITSENSVISHWLSLGADGFRLDVADELPDEFIALLHDRVHRIKKGAIVIGEVWEDASNKISYGVRRKYFTSSELDSVMNYPFRDAIISFIKGASDAFSFSEAIMTICENYPFDVLNRLMTSLSTHDTERILTLLSDCERPEGREGRAEYRLSASERETAVSRVLAASFLQFMLPGAPCIYYGDEAGAEGFEDPFNRGFFPWGKEDLRLTAHYQRLAELKNALPELKSGNTLVHSPDNSTVIIERTLGASSVYAVVSLNEAFEIPEKEIIFSSSQNSRLSKYGFALYK